MRMVHGHHFLCWIILNQRRTISHLVKIFPGKEGGVSLAFEVGGECLDFLCPLPIRTATVSRQRIVHGAITVDIFPGQDA